MANKADLEKGLALRNKLLGKRASGAATVIAELAPDLDRSCRLSQRLAV